MSNQQPGLVKYVTRDAFVPQVSVCVVAGSWGEGRGNLVDETPASAQVTEQP